MPVLIQPKEITIDGIEFTISKLPATVAIEIMARGAAAAIPSVGNFSVVEEMMVKTMSYVAVKHPNLGLLYLDSKIHIDNQCPDWRTYLKVLEAMREYNHGFFIHGNILDSLKNLTEMLPQKMLKMFTRLSQASSTQDSPPLAS